MNANYRVITLLFSMLLIPSVALAQQTYKSEAEFGLSRVLAYKGVSEDLQMDATQTEQLSGLWTLVEIKLRQEFRKYRGDFSPRLSKGEKELLSEELADGVTKVREFETERLEEALSQSQIDRLGQIRYQLVGQKSRNLTYLKDDLDISKEQLAALKELVNKRSTELQKIRHSARVELLTPNEVLEFSKEVKKELEGEIQEVLTAEQRRKLERLKGKTFEFQVGQPKPDPED